MAFFLAGSLVNSVEAGSNESTDGRALQSGITVDAGDWPWWRGPGRNGIADAKQTVPVRWSETDNIIWKAAVPGKGHGSPIIVGNRVVIATADADRQVQSLICFDRANGTQMWESVIHEGGLTTKGNEKSSLASATPAFDGEYFFINFLNNDGIWVTAVDRDGKKVWQIRLCDYILHQGFAASPAVYQNLVLVAADHKGKGVMAGLDRKTGQVVWKRERPALPNYPSPVVLHVAGKDQLIMQGCNLVTGLNPVSGDQLWEIEGATEECVTSTVTDGLRIFTGGGYPKNHMAAVMADGSGKVSWETNTRSYVPSMVVRDGYLYTILDNGVAVCSRCDTGEEVWKERLNGTFSSSLVLAGELLFATNEDGKTWVFKATPAAYEEVAQNQLGQNVFGTPSICGDRIYHRVAMIVDGKRQEWLYCIGESSR